MLFEKSIRFILLLDFFHLSNSEAKASNRQVERNKIRHCLRRNPAEAGLDARCSMPDKDEKIPLIIQYPEASIQHHGLSSWDHVFL
jgi:hypothetical protein